MSAGVGTVIAWRAGVGTVIARQNPCQLRGLATPDRAIFFGNIHNYFGNISLDFCGKF